MKTSVQRAQRVPASASAVAQLRLAHCECQVSSSCGQEVNREDHQGVTFGKGGSVHEEGQRQDGSTFFQTSCLHRWMVVVRANPLVVSHLAASRTCSIWVVCDFTKQAFVGRNHRDQGLLLIVVDVREHRCLDVVQSLIQTSETQCLIELPLSMA